MLFTSYAFLGFLATLFLLYYLVPGRFQWKLLLAASYLFYFAAGPAWLLYILATTVTTYFAALRIEDMGRRQKAYIKANKDQLSKEEKKVYKNRIKSGQWRWLLACLLFNLGILAVVKYTNFAISNVNGLLRAVGSARQFGFWDIALPMGISFYTFQALGYLIDVYRGTVEAERNPGRLALFVSFFPQLIQGPISRFGDLAQSLFAEHGFDGKRFSYGLERILWGYFKKLVIADRILTGVNTIIRDTGTYRGAYVFVGMLFYALELYADFTGGIDITIGIAQSLGIGVKENFHRLIGSERVLAQMAYHHGNLVYGLHILSHIRLQAHAEILPVCQGTFWRMYRKESPCLPLFLRGVAGHGDLARRKLELRGLGAGKLGDSHGFPGVGAFVCQIPWAVPGAGQLVVQAVSGGPYRAVDELPAHL